MPKDVNSDNYREIDWDKVKTTEDIITLFKQAVNPLGIVYTVGLDVSKFEHLLKEDKTENKP